jgi:hypothetical protein
VQLLSLPHRWGGHTTELGENPCIVTLACNDFRAAGLSERFVRIARHHRRANASQPNHWRQLPTHRMTDEVSLVAVSGSGTHCVMSAVADPGW